MGALRQGDAFPEGVAFTYVPPTGSLDLTVCGRPIGYDASKEFKNKKVVLVAVPGAFTPTCQEQHVTSYLAHVADFKRKGVDAIIIIASNDAFVMSAWGKANGVHDESIFFMTDDDAKFSKSIGWNFGDRTNRYAIVVDHGKVVYTALETELASIASSGAEPVLAAL
ncbi:putative peroxiredoxin pmp20 [Corynascus novoguineensis]|uniref:Thioredoxin peroxidase n=1 Tax=Corynascus novoguineensis TaxID=1126955 RepID=A0AAN7CKX7_9PEZI|nr:putative peroxiredoxin pmp20 [Corynascus novoguineensis]